MSTSQRAGILPITSITPSLKPGPARIALSNRQTLLAGRRAGTEKYNLQVCEYPIRFHWFGDRFWSQGPSEQHLTDSVQQELWLNKQKKKSDRHYLSKLNHHNPALVYTFGCHKDNNRFLGRITTIFLNAQKWKTTQFLCVLFQHYFAKKVLSPNYSRLVSDECFSTKLHRAAGLSSEVFVE